MKRIPENKVILFVTDHYNPLGILRGLGEDGIRPIVVIVGENPVLVNKSKYVGELYVTKTNEEAYELIMSRWGGQPLKPFIFTGSDDIALFLDDHYDELIDKFYFYNCGAQGRHRFFMNKEENTLCAQRNGINLPKEEKLNRGELPTTLRYPVLTKAIYTTEGAWKKDVYICQNEEELIEAYKHIKSPRLLVQEYIDKENELSINGLSIDGGREVIMPFLTDYIRLYKNAYGHYMTLRPFPETEELYKQIHATVKEMGFSGLFEAELLLDKDGKTYFLEINLRATTWGYAITYGGVNLPVVWMQATVENHIDPESYTVRQEPFTAMVEPLDYLLNVKRGDLPAWKWWRDFLFRTDCCYFWNKQDPKPFWSWMRKNWKQFVWKNITH